MTGSQNNADRKYSELRLLYQLTADGITFLKNQQWRVTNYALLLYGAIGGLGIHISKNPEDYKLPFLINSLAPPHNFYLKHDPFSKISNRYT